MYFKDDNQFLPVKFNTRYNSITTLTKCDILDHFVKSLYKMGKKITSKILQFHAAYIEKYIRISQE